MNYSYDGARLWISTTREYIVWFFGRRQTILPNSMTIEEVRAVLWPKYNWIPDETLRQFVDLVEAVSYYVIALDKKQNDSSYNSNETHDH